MSFKHLTSLPDGQIKLCFSNENVEDYNSAGISTAGDFKIVLDSQIDLNPIIYMKSIDAEIALHDLYIIGKPLSFTEKNFISIYTLLPENLADTNISFSKTDLKRKNQNPLKISLQNISLTTFQEGLDLINAILDRDITMCVLLRLIQIFIDKEIFSTSFEKTKTPNSACGISQDTYELLTKYLYFANYCRLQYLAILDELLKITKEDSKIFNVFKQSDPISFEKERQTIHAEHSIFRPTETRKRSRLKLIDLKKCVQVNLADLEIKAALDVQLVEGFMRYLTAVGCLETKSKNNYDPKKSELTQESISNLKIVRQNVIDIFGLAPEILKLLDLELKKNQFKSLGTELSDAESSVVKLKLDKKSEKCYFAFQNSITAHKIKICFDQSISKILGYHGSQDDQIIVVKTHENIISRSQDLISNRIVSESQRLPYAMRLGPRVLHFLTDLVENSSQNTIFWVQNSKSFQGLFPINSQPIINEDGKTHLNFKFFSNDITKDYFTIRSSETIFDNFRIVLLDEFFSPIVFGKRSLIYFSFYIRPSIK